MSGAGVTFGVRQSDLARRWAVSRQTVSRYVAEGMPLDSVEMAEAWRLQVKGKGGIPRGGIPADNNCSAAGESAPEKTDAGGLGELMRRTADTEELVWLELQAAIQGGEGAELRTALLRQHKAAADIRLKVHQECVDFEMKIGKLVNIEEAKVLCRQALAPLAVGLRAFAGKVAVKANPARPEVAQKAIDEEVQRLLRAYVEGLAT